MAKTPRNPSDLAAQVAETEMPGWKAVKEISLTSSNQNSYYHMDSSDSDPLGTTADAVMPSTEQLKAKYLGAPQADSSSAIPQADTSSNETDTALVELESGPLKKTVAVSKAQKKVIWSQG